MITFELSQSSDRMQVIVDSLAPLRSSLSLELGAKLNLVVEEIIENVFDNNDHDGLYVKVTIDFIDGDQKQALITFCDNGNAFDLTEQQLESVPNPDRLRGRGIYLVKHYTNSISYERDQDLNLLKVGVLIISLGFEEESSKTLEKIVSLLGRPHTHSTGDDAVWHIKQGGSKGNEALARSHKLSEFVLHTDCSYEKQIPDFFGLHCIRHDRFGGGKNLLVDCSTLIQHLTPESFEALQNDPVEIVVPPEFKRDIESISARVIDKNFNVRYRKEILKKETLTPALQSALEEFERLCHSPVLNRKLELKDNQILLLDNNTSFALLG
ncbi:TauD/TfdA family dioxygenase [Piscirickettsia litoralis]|uniref:Histidine kinase/HSP90-like ATPase domain-containing protein n=1 Tax=Piscirickettsia litoralis TaxID=1891921 RepID=A0ABX3A3B6_9GAMM|nr:TauD/TfdA family dioxygenase [Piscirickettsia litoralis]ODN43134.1 hypothetical protein BGC07_09690 [Piscirickettsia litoralis]